MHIVIIQGHPDSSQTHYCHALAGAYQRGAEAAGHSVDIIDCGALGLQPLISPNEWRGPPDDHIADLQQRISAANHLVILFPIWMGTMPALLKAFFEQVARPGFALPKEGQPSPFGKKALSGRSARLIVTMGMPAFAYTFFYRAHGVKVLERNILKFIGISPVRRTLIGGVEAMGDSKRKAWLDKIEQLGRRAG